MANPDKNEKLLKTLDEKTIKTEKIKQYEREEKRKEDFRKGVDAASTEVVKFGDKVKRFFSKKHNVVLFVIGCLAFIGGLVALAILTANGKIFSSSNNGGAVDESQTAQKVEKFYDNLTGELISYSGVQYNTDGTEKMNDNGERDYLTEMQAKQIANNLNARRINCVQIPNGTDARPQVGLTEAKIVYEAIAEGGITRFAAIYRGATSDVIGPVRSLRTYYLEWDIPYNCTIVHAGGEAVALERVRGYDHLSESSTYMWRDHSAYYAPNNLFTSSELLNNFNNDNNFSESKPKTFARMTPEKADSERKKIVETQAEQKERAEKGLPENEGLPKYVYANQIYVHITASPYYNVSYTYDAGTNSYKRFYEAGNEPHLVYLCKGLDKSGNKIAPTKDCATTHVSPKVVVVVKVPEQLNQDNLYREDIKTSGSGDAWVFENGIVIEATWEKADDNAQISFKERDSGKELKLAPGQTFITAVAESYGYTNWQ